MPSWIDHEAEATHAVFGGGDEEVSLRFFCIPLAAGRRDDFNHAGVVARRDRRYDVPVARVSALEFAAVLFVGFARKEDDSGDRFSRVRPTVLQRALGRAALETRKQMRERDRDERPGRVLFVPAASGAQQRMHFPVSFGREMVAAVACGRMAGHPFVIDGRALRSAPGVWAREKISVRRSAFFSRWCSAFSITFARKAASSASAPEWP